MLDVINKSEIEKTIEKEFGHVTIRRHGNQEHLIKPIGMTFIDSLKEDSIMGIDFLWEESEHDHARSYCILDENSKIWFGWNIGGDKTSDYETEYKLNDILRMAYSDFWSTGEVYFPRGLPMGVGTGNITYDPVFGLMNASSALKYKENVKNLVVDPSWLLTTQPRTFTFKNDQGHRPNYGYIADELILLDEKAGVYSWTVTYNQQTEQYEWVKGDVENKNDDYLLVSLIELCKQQQNTINTLNTTVDTLNTTITTLQTNLTTLENRVTVLEGYHV